MAAANLSPIDKLKDYWTMLDTARSMAKLDCTEAITKRPSNGVTIKEYAEHYLLSEYAAKKQLQRLAKEGHVKPYRVVLLNSDHKLARVNVYVPINEGKGVCDSVTSSKTATKPRGTALAVGARR